MPASARKKKSEQSSFLVYLYAVTMAVFGVLLGMVYLMSFPITAYSNMQERARDLEDRESLDPVPGGAYYIEGPILRSRSWETKRKQLIEGAAQSITVSPGEVNAWFEAKFRGSKPATNEESSGLVLVPGLPNLAITREGTVFLNLPVDIEGYGLDGSYVLSAQIRYADGSPAKIVVDHLQIGGAAVPLPGQLGSQLVSTLIKGFSSAEEYGVISQAWRRVGSVEVANGALALTLDTP
jgi:hypothetical protein